MKKRQITRQLTGQRGQTLVWVAISLVALMGLVGLAVDGGNLLSSRRHMQNTADAAALEAARARCFDNVSAADAEFAGEQFAEDNYVRPNSISHDYQVDARDDNDWEFVATVSEVVPLTFLRMVPGILLDEQTVGAQAAAACGASPVACGMFPLAFKEAIWEGISDQCGQTFYVWTSELDRENINPNKPTPVPVSCDTCDCTTVYDHHDDPIPGAIALADTGRAWLDFTSAASEENPVDCGGNNGCGQAEITCWIKSDSQVVLLQNTCVSGTNGIKFGAKNAINGTGSYPGRVGDYVNIPLFDGRCAPAASPSGHACDDQGFNISGYGCVQVQEWAPQKVQLAWAQPPDPPESGKKYCVSGAIDKCNDWCISEKMLPVKVGCDPNTKVSLCETECGYTTGGGDPGAGIKAVSLIPLTPVP